jgi:hypothetical protein
MSALPPKADIVRHGGNVASLFALHREIPAQKEKGPAQWPVPQSPALAFGNDRRRRGLALAVVRSGLCGGRDGEERQRRCRQ